MFFRGKLVSQQMQIMHGKNYGFVKVKIEEDYQMQLKEGEIVRIKIDAYTSYSGDLINGKTYIIKAEYVLGMKDMRAKSIIFHH